MHKTILNFISAIFCIILLVIGISSNLAIYFILKKFFVVAFIFNFIPFLLSSTLHFGIIKIKGWQRFVLFSIGWTLILVSLLYVIFLDFGIIFLESATTPVSELSRYQEIRNSWASQYVSHFPERIPKNVVNSSFYYQPGFLQGVSSIELRMKLPPLEINVIAERFRGQEIQVFRCKGQEKGEIEKPKYIPESENPENKPLDTSFKVIILGDTFAYPKCEWNHGKRYGLAFSKSTSEVIYWAFSG